MDVYEYVGLCEYVGDVKVMELRGVLDRLVVEWRERGVVNPVFIVVTPDRGIGRDRSREFRRMLERVGSRGGDFVGAVVGLRWADVIYRGIAVVFSGEEEDIDRYRGLDRRRVFYGYMY